MRKLMFCVTAALSLAWAIAGTGIMPSTGSLKHGVKFLAALQLSEDGSIILDTESILANATGSTRTDF